MQEDPKQVKYIFPDRHKHKGNQKGDKLIGKRPKQLEVINLFELKDKTNYTVPEASIDKMTASS